jgi:anti-anti-sigma factor
MAAEPLSIEVTEPAPGVVVVEVAGEIDLGTVERVEEALGAPAAAGRRVVVDLSECGFVDSSGLRALVAARTAAVDAGGSLALVTADRNLLRVLAVAALDTVLEVHPTRDDALGAAG